MQITICSDHAEFPDLKLTIFGTKPIFEKLRSVWLSLLWSCLSCALHCNH